MKDYMPYSLLGYPQLLYLFLLLLFVEVISNLHDQ